MIHSLAKKVLNKIICGGPRARREYSCQISRKGNEMKPSGTELEQSDEMSGLEVRGRSQAPGIPNGTNVFGVHFHAAFRSLSAKHHSLTN